MLPHSCAQSKVDELVLTCYNGCYNNLEHQMSSMPEIEPGPRKRFYEIRWSGETEKTSALAERFFEDRDEAFDYYEQRQCELAPRRVHPPSVPSAEDDNRWEARWVAEFRRRRGRGAARLAP